MPGTKHGRFPNSATETSTVVALVSRPSGNLLCPRNPATPSVHFAWGAELVAHTNALLSHLRKYFLYLHWRPHLSLGSHQNRSSVLQHCQRLFGCLLNFFILKSDSHSYYWRSARKMLWPQLRLSLLLFRPNLYTVLALMPSPVSLHAFTGSSLRIHKKEHWRKARFMSFSDL